MTDRHSSFDPNDEVVSDDQSAMTERADDATGAAEDEEFEELIIEDFTIDGICGVY